MTWKDIELNLQDSPVNGQLFQKSTPSKGLLVFGTGFASISDDYMQLLNPLTENFDVLSMNNRGHGANKEKFDVKLLKNDLHEISKQEDVSFYLGHSVGASMDSDVPTFMINPYLGPKFINVPMRLGLYASKLGTMIGLNAALSYIDSKKPFAKNNGFNNSNFLRDFYELTKVEKPIIDGKHGFFFSDNDAVIGTNRANPMYSLRVEMLHAYRRAVEYKKLGKGLNHCLNMKPKDHAPFLKDEEGKKTNKIIKTITNFYLK